MKIYFRCFGHSVFWSFGVLVFGVSVFGVLVFGDLAFRCFDLYSSLSLSLSPEIRPTPKWLGLRPKWSQGHHCWAYKPELLTCRLTTKGLIRLGNGTGWSPSWSSKTWSRIPKTLCECSHAPHSWLAYTLGPHPTVTWLAVGRLVLF